MESKSSRVSSDEIKNESELKSKVSFEEIEIKNDPFRFADDSDVETESETRFVCFQVLKC